MASRLFETRTLNLVKNLVMLEGNFKVNGSGEAVEDKGNGILSIAKGNANGKFVITLEDSYSRFMGFGATIVAASHSGIFCVEVLSQDVSAATPVITIQCYNASGVATAPAENAMIFFHVLLRNSSIAGKGE